MCLLSVTVIGNHNKKLKTRKITVCTQGQVNGWRELRNSRHSHAIISNNFQRTLVMINEYGHNNFLCKLLLCMCVSRARKDNMKGREQGRDRMVCDCTDSRNEGVNFTNIRTAVCILLRHPKCIQRMFVVE